MPWKRRPVDISKKCNIRCENCAYIRGSFYGREWSVIPRCARTGEIKMYYQRCMGFAWRPDKIYINSKGIDQADFGITKEV
jgi:hypothetical protein